MKIFTTEDPEILRLISKNNNLVNLELFTTNDNNHKFKKGEIVELTGLVDFPEFNGEKVTITNIREDGANGKAYYIGGRINTFLNWVYEYRLKKII